MCMMFQQFLYHQVFHRQRTPQRKRRKRTRISMPIGENRRRRRRRGIARRERKKVVIPRSPIDTGCYSLALRGLREDLAGLQNTYASYLLWGELDLSRGENRFRLPFRKVFRKECLRSSIAPALPLLRFCTAWNSNCALDGMGRRESCRKDSCSLF